MTFLTAAPQVLAEAYQKHELPVPGIVFPVIAICIFTLLGFVAWSFRDVANRHAGKGAGPHTEHGPGI